jgi:hypothetical protein
MELRESFQINRSFPEACQYIQGALFPRLKETGVGPVIQLHSPRIFINESKRFGMVKVLEKRMTLRIEASEDNNGRAFVTVMSRLDITWNIVSTIILGVTTCGIFALIFVPVIFVKKNRWAGYFRKTVALLRSDLTG